MEWQEERKVEIPPELLQHLARNLFLEGQQAVPVQHPAEEAIATLLGISARAEVPLPNGGKLELDKKGLGEVRKARSDGK
jgi:hypothetical protein